MFEEVALTKASRVADTIRRESVALTIKVEVGVEVGDGVQVKEGVCVVEAVGSPVEEGVGVREDLVWRHQRERRKTSFGSVRPSPSRSPPASLGQDLRQRLVKLSAGLAETPVGYGKGGHVL